MGTSTVERAARVALSQLPGVGPSRLRWLMQDRTASDTFAGLCDGTVPIADGRAPSGVNATRIAEWRSAARALTPGEMLDRHQDAGIAVLIPGDPHWPFGADPEPPSVLYVWGDSAVLSGQPRVAIVGTRRCTEIGRGVANELGNELAAAGVSVVSGLALGIDGAAHAGALTARSDLPPGQSGAPIAVVANGLDCVSPKFHRALTEAVASHGAVVSEAPLGVRGDRWRFPARNRLIAGLSEIVIVVESHERGGALITVDEAIERGVPVMAVPGSIRSPASLGTNRLLADGAVPLCSVRDVLEALDLHDRERPEPAEQGMLFTEQPDEGDDSAGGDATVRQRIVAELATGPQSLDTLVLTSGRSLSEIMVEVQRLAADGLVAQVGSTISAVTERSSRRR